MIRVMEGVSKKKIPFEMQGRRFGDIGKIVAVWFLMHSFIGLFIGKKGIRMDNSALTFGYVFRFMELGI
jgi:hypothetical protein